MQIKIIFIFMDHITIWETFVIAYFLVNTPELSTEFGRYIYKK